MTGELCAILNALKEITLLCNNAKCLIRFDCIPAMMLATGVYRCKKNDALVDLVHTEWKKVAETHVLYHQHAKGHSKIYGNVRADKAAEKGATVGEVQKKYMDVTELGGIVRFVEYYHPGDCGRDCDLERKNAGKVKARRQKVFNKNTDNHYRAILGHARFLEPEVRKTISEILK